MTYSNPYTDMDQSTKEWTIADSALDGPSACTRKVSGMFRAMMYFVRAGAIEGTVIWENHPTEVALQEIDNTIRGLSRRQCTDRERRYPPKGPKFPSNLGGQLWSSGGFVLGRGGEGGNGKYNGNGNGQPKRSKQKANCIDRLARNTRTKVCFLSSFRRILERIFSLT